MKKIAIIIAAIATGWVLYFFVRVGSFYNTIYKPHADSLLAKVQVTPKPKTEHTILLLGYGGPGHDGAYLTDTMLVLHFDTVKKRAVLVSVPRDLWVKLKTSSGTPFGSKINLVYEAGRFPKDFPDIDQTGMTNPTDLVEQTVKDITGLSAENYATVDFSAFRKIVDLVGGVDVNVQKTFTDTQYPIDGHEDDLCGKTEADLPELEKVATGSPELAFPCRYETLNFTKGMTHMDGVTALKYVRSRHGNFDAGDFGRSQRQHQFLMALKDKILSIGFIPKIVPALDQLGTDVTTDISPADFQKYLDYLSHAKEYKIDNLVMTDNDYLDYGRSPDGQSILMPKEGMDKWDNVKTWIHDAIEEITPTPTPRPTIVATPSAKLLQKKK
jgi:polyisoprenyl-teichoic acid--peptidoglycan teichoic acid transferase